MYAAILIDSDKSVTLSEVHSSSVNSTCVDVSLPFLNDPSTIDSSNEQSPSPNTKKTFEFYEDKSDSDKNEVNPEHNMMQILHAESPQQSLILSALDRCDLHRPPSCIPDMDNGGDSPSDRDSSCSEPNSLREDVMDEWQMSEEDEGSDTTDFGLLNKEKQGAAGHPSDKPSDTDNCTQCEMYTMTFGGMYTYTATPSPEIEDRDKEVKPDLKQSDQGVDAQLTSKTDSAPYEIYTMNFGGLYTFNSTTLDDSATELDQYSNQRGEQLPEKGEDDLVKSMEDKEDKQSEPTAPYEVYTVKFGGLHTFTTSPSVSDNSSEPLSTTSQKTEANLPTTPYEVYTVSFGGLQTFTTTSDKRSELLPTTSQNTESNLGLPMEVQEQRESLKVDKDCKEMSDDRAACTPYEVHTVTFGGLYTFTATLPHIQCDGAPPMHAA